MDSLSNDEALDVLRLQSVVHDARCGRPEHHNW